MRTQKPHARSTWLALLLSVIVAMPVAATPSPALEPVVFVGAGDIASCFHDNDEATARLLDGIEGTVFTLGDNAYDSGTPAEFAECYAPTWGRHVERTRPTPGNHDYDTEGASGYFGYFGLNAGDPSQGYYSFDLGEWHIVALNTNCEDIGGCDEGSLQYAWLAADLAANPARCILAYGHHPRFSSGPHGAESDVGPLWELLYQHGAEIFLAGHDHTYERFVPQDPKGGRDDLSGIRQFVVGTGGASPYTFEVEDEDTEARSNEAFGVLKLTLDAGSYTWEFVPVEGGTFTDMGTGACH